MLSDEFSKQVISIIGKSNMPRSICLLILCCGLVFNLQAQSHKLIDDLIAQLEHLSPSEQNKHLASFVSDASQVPVIDGRYVLFLVKSADVEPLIMADFNGFLNSRYIADESIGNMTQIEKSDWYYKVKQFAPLAVINYMYRIGDEETLDPLNPNSRENFGTQVSVIRLSPKLDNADNIGVATGKIIEHEFESKVLDHMRKVFVYLPPNYEVLKDLPTAYFHDGSFHLKDMEAPAILNELIQSQSIVPVIAIFDNPVMRGKEYQGDEDYKNYLQNELIPFIDNTYATKNTNGSRAVIGFSRGGMSALYVSYSTPLFAKVGVFSPAIHPTSIDDFITELGAFDYSPKEFFITGSLYDFIWYSDAVKLREVVQDDYIVNYKEIPMGHNIQSWQHLLDDMLIAFFGY